MQLIASEMKKTKLIRKLLAAIAAKSLYGIFRAANELGLRTVAIYSQEDRLALHRFKADEAYQVGAGKAPWKPIWDIVGIVALAKEKGRGRHPPGLRFSFRESRVRPGLRKGQHHLRWSVAESSRVAWDKTAAEDWPLRRELPVLPGTENPVKSARGAKGRSGDRLSPHCESGDGWRRPWHASRP